MALPSQVRALTFDVFGTVVDWLTPVTASLTSAASRKLSSSSDLSSTTLTALQTTNWTDFARAWRASYGVFTRNFIPGKTSWKDIDTHHRDSLVDLLQGAGLGGVFTSQEIDELSKVWHFLTPWDDAVEGLRRLRAGYTVATLSNGNTALLADLDKHGGLGFDRLISAEEFHAYKPRAEVYRGACAVLEKEPGEVAMVAAHLGDLVGARAVGLRAVYVERHGEEEWRADEERYGEAKKWVDVWIGKDEGGFEELARRLGL